MATSASVYQPFILSLAFRGLFFRVAHAKAKCISYKRWSRLMQLAVFF